MNPIELSLPHYSTEKLNRDYESKLLQDDCKLVEKLGGEGIEPWVSFLKRGDVEEGMADSEWIVKNKKNILGV